MTSICSLIYKSTRYADAVWDSVHEFTPEIGRGEARFFFVANDPTDDLLRHLRLRGYFHVIHKNIIDGLEGYDPPEYIRRVYKGWNRAIMESDEKLVLVNSDCMFSEGWFSALMSRLKTDNVVCSKIVERQHPKYGKFNEATEGDFGDHPDRFRKHEFMDFSRMIRRNDVESGGAYMPCAIYRETALKAGLYPEGNPKGSYGDRSFFDKLAFNGVKHVTALNSIVYHFKEGEMSE